MQNVVVPPKLRKPRSGTLADRWRYGFDTFMARGTVALISGLGLVSLAFIALMAVLVTASGMHPADGDKLNLPESLWGF